LKNRVKSQYTISKSQLKQHQYINRENAIRKK